MAEPEHSKPYRVFETNLRRLTDLSAMQNAPMQETVNRTTLATEKACAAARKLGEAKRAEPETPEHTAFQEYAQGLLAEMAAADAGITSLKTLLNTAHFLRSWMLVMLVTFTEAYLEDVFSLLLTAGFQGGSLPPTATEKITKKWSKDATRRGGPPAWIIQLTEFGVTGYDPKLAGQMKKVWDRRVSIVHKAEPEITATSWQEFIDAAKLLNDFVETTDRFVVAIHSAAGIAKPLT